MKDTRAVRPRGISRLDGLRLAFDRLLLRGLHYRLIFAALVVIAVALVGGLLVWQFDPNFKNLSDSVWWAFLRLTDPGYLGDDEGVVGRSVSTMVTVLGYLLFLGLLIAILTQWMNELIERIESGIRPLHLKNHVLILGYTHRTPTIAREMLRTRGRLTRFLQARDTKELYIVVMDEAVDRSFINNFKEQMGELWDDRQVLLRKGSPLKFDHLERVSFDDAAAIILPGEDFSSRSPGVADADTLKTLLSISRHTRAVENSRPLAVAALYDVNRTSVAKRAYGGDTEILAVDQIASRLIARSVRQPGLWSVFSQLLSINEGNTLYVSHLKTDAAKEFAEVLAAYSRAVPIGLIPAGESRPVLNPDAGTVVNPGDMVVFIAASYADCTEADWSRSLPAPQDVSKVPPAAMTESRRILILGWSRKVPALLRELSQDSGRIDVIGLTPLEDREEALARYGDLPENSFRQVQANFLDPVILAELEPGQYDHIIILARARMGNEAHADAATITAYLSLQEILAAQEQRPGVFVELREQENSFLFDTERDDVLVSPQIISFLLSQIALRRELASLFAELSRVGGPQIELKKLSPDDYAEPVGFDELAMAARGRGEIALGLLPADNEPELNPDRTKRWQIERGDQLIILATAREPHQGGAQTDLG
ncbi:MAG: hypothetical protein ABJ308_14920 [Halieaceae bacterium]